MERLPSVHGGPGGSKALHHRGSSEPARHRCFAGAAAGGSINSAPPCCERGAADLCDDFVLHSSQTYERGLSQLMPPWDEGLEGGSSTQEGEGELTQTQLQLAEASQRRQQQQEQAVEVQRRLQLGDGGAQPSGSSAAGQGGQALGPLRRISSVSNCSNRTTPGVPMVREEEAAACSGAAPRLFPVFRSRKDYKVGARGGASWGWRVLDCACCPSNLSYASCAPP